MIATVATTATTTSVSTHTLVSASVATSGRSWLVAGAHRSHPDRVSLVPSASGVRPTDLPTLASRF